MWGHRVVIPSKTRPKMLEVLHESHPGISKAKALALDILGGQRLMGT